MLMNNECDCYKCQNGKLYKYSIEKTVKNPDGTFGRIFLRQIVVTCEAHAKSFIIYQEYPETCVEDADPLTILEACEEYKKRSNKNDD